MDWNEYFFRHVYLVASKSKDPRTKIGSIIVRDNHIIASGYNGFPTGIKDLPERYNDKKTKYNFIVHSEANAILQCVKLGISAKGAVLFSQGLPCCECSKKIIQSGIIKVVIHEQWPNLIYSEAWCESIKISKIMFEEAGIQIESYDKDLGLTGFLDGKEIEV